MALDDVSLLWHEFRALGDGFNVLRYYCGLPFGLSCENDKKKAHRNSSHLPGLYPDRHLTAQTSKRGKARICLIPRLLPLSSIFPEITVSYLVVHYVSSAELSDIALDTDDTFNWSYTVRFYRQWNA